MPELRNKSRHRLSNFESCVVFSIVVGDDGIDVSVKKKHNKRGTNLSRVFPTHNFSGSAPEESSGFLSFERTIESASNPQLLEETETIGYSKMGDDGRRPSYM